MGGGFYRKYTALAWVSGWGLVEEMGRFTQQVQLTRLSLCTINPTPALPLIRGGSLDTAERGLFAFLIATAIRSGLIDIPQITLLIRQGAQFFLGPLHTHGALACDHLGEGGVYVLGHAAGVAADV